MKYQMKYIKYKKWDEGFELQFIEPLIFCNQFAIFYKQAPHFTYTRNELSKRLSEFQVKLSLEMKRTMKWRGSCSHFYMNSSLISLSLTSIIVYPKQ
jgi:hypothetical protein